MSLTIGEAADYLHVTTQTVRKYTKEGKLDCYTTPAGHRRFTVEQLDAFLGRKPEETYAFYARSSKGAKTAINNQFEVLREKYGDPVAEYKDTSSGLNEKRPGLWRAYRDAQKGKFSHLVVTHKDRLTRFGWAYLEELFDTQGVIIIVEQELPEKSIYDELMDDFMSLIASFSGKFYRIRNKENQNRLLDDAKNRVSQYGGDSL